MRRVRSQFLQSVVGRLGFAVRGRGVSGGTAGASSSRGSGAPAFKPALSATSLASLLVLAFVVVGGLPAVALAVPKAIVGSFGKPNGPLGGQLVFAKGVAVNQTGNGAPAGTVYVAEANPNHRISQFSASGEFIRAWGYDVVSTGEHNTGANEQQTVTIAPTVTSGTFSLRFGGTTASGIPWNATPAQVQSALEGIAGIGTGNVSVSSPNPGGGSSVGGPFTVTFQGALGGNDVPGMGQVNTTLVGNPRTVSIATPVPGGGVEVCEADSSPVDVCKAGVSGSRAGQLTNPAGIAIDQTNGYLYVTNGLSSRRVDVFSGTGEFAGAFGWGVDTGGAAVEFCTTASGCQAGPMDGLTDTAGHLGMTEGAVAWIPAVDPNVPGRVYVPDTANLRVSQYSATIAEGTLTGVSFDKAFGWGVDTGANALESCTTASTCQAGLSGNGAGQFSSGGSPGAVAVDNAGAIYVTSGPLDPVVGTGTGTCSSATPCRVQKFAPGASSATDFGPTSGPGQLVFEEGESRAVAAVSIAIDPSNDHVFVQRRDSESGYRVLEYDSAGNYLETHPSASSLPGTGTGNVSPGLAVGTDDRVYTNMGAGGAGEVFILASVDDPIPTMGPVTDAGSTTATFEGTVEIPAPGAPTFATTYHFEYTKNGVDWASVPVPDANVGDGTTGSHSVSYGVTGLEPSTLYAARLVATTGNAGVLSNVVSFTTDAVAPRIAMTFTDEVTQTTAQLGAHVDPEGLATTYHFEWGSAPCSTNACARVPAFERQLGGGNTIVIAKEQIGDLDSATAYHYRVVATNAAGTINGPDHRFETLNSCGLTDGRCLEMVSPRDKGPTGAAGDIVSLGKEANFQVAPDGSAIQYVIAYGLPDATAGEEVSYLAQRAESRWMSSQLAAPALEVRNDDGTANPSRNLGLSESLGCGFFASPQALADDAPQAALDQGGSLLYRRDNASGTWRTVTNLAPSARVDAPPRFEYTVIGFSDSGQDACDRVVFRTKFQYPGVPGTGDYRLYRWQDGSLENVGLIPGPSGPEVAQVVPGATAGGVSVGGENASNYWNAVSKDASRIIFTAVSRVGGDTGKRAVFLQDGDDVALNVSQSQTATPNDRDSYYQTASTDGSKLFFVARHGLAQNNSSSEPNSCAAAQLTSAAVKGVGCNLYRYSVGDGVLTDLSIDHSGTDAGVVGVLDASEDGSRVYFAARGQLVPGQGNTRAENLADDAYSVYLSDEDDDDLLRYVGQVRETDKAALIAFSVDVSSDSWSSQATPTGSHLLFASRAKFTEYGDGLRPETYLYDADANTTICVSCRRDMQPSSMPVLGGAQIVSGFDVQNWSNPPLSITDDGRRVFFISPNRLAHGATEGQRALYQWENGQISLIGDSGPGTTNVTLPRFAGASHDGDDVYFATVDQLTWEDTDGKLDVYAARVGGGFAQPPAPPAACDPLASGCQGGGSDAVSTDTKTSSPSRSGNVSVEGRKSLALLGLSRKARTRASRRGVLPLRLRSSSAGRVKLAANAKLGKRVALVGRKTIRIREAGMARVDLRLNFRARKRLRSGKGLRVAIQVRQSGARTRTRSILLPGVRS